MEKPVVSIGMPFLNGQRFIAEAVESILAQTYSRWELLLVDDGSTDASSDIARAYANAHPGRMRYLEHEGHQNRGISASRNLAVRHARGRYVGFLDADDVWLPHKLTAQVSILEAHPDVSFVYGPYNCWYGWTGLPDDSKRDFTQDLGVAPGVVFPPPTLLTRLYPLGQLATPSMSDFLATRALFDTVGGFEEQFRGMYEDHAFLVKVYLNAGVIVGAECWDRYRMHPESCVSTATKDGLHRAVRAEFFRWFESYLRSRNVTDNSVWSAYAAALERRRTIEDHYGGWLFRVAPGNAAQLVIPRGSPDILRIAITTCETSDAWDIQLNQPRFTTREGRQYTARFRARADHDRSIGVGISMAHEPWSNLGMYHDIALSPQWQDFAIDFTALADEDNARIHFDLGGSLVSAEIDAVSLSRPDGSPAPTLQFGDLRRITPVSRNWGYDRGDPVDRYYIEAFLARHAADIYGHVLEVMNNDYTRRFGGDRVVRSDVLDVVTVNERATIIGDLASLPQVADATFDCIILTQTLQYLIDPRAAIATLRRILKPGGVLLATVPGISQTHVGGTDHYWNFTAASARRLFGDGFAPGSVEIDGFGNILAAISLLHGLPAQELQPGEIDHHDAAYEVTITIRAVREHASQAATERAAVKSPGRQFGGKALILMYHRVSDALADPFGLSVGPDRLAEHLDVVRRTAHPMALTELTQALADDAIPPKSVVVTFDDGYADNLFNARPTLERFDIPATVFVATGYLDQDREFWWDELERILEPGELPGTLELAIGGQHHQWQLNGSARYDPDACRLHRRWNAEHDQPPTPRHVLFSALWSLAHSMSDPDRRALLDQIGAWAGVGTASRPEYRALTSAELLMLARGSLVEIGAHTVTHPALGLLSREAQQVEIAHSKTRLEDLVGGEIGSFSFPHGSRSADSDTIVKGAGFARACCSIRSVVDVHTDRFLLPRVQVENWDGDQFATHLSSWLAQ